MPKRTMFIDITPF